MSGLSPTSYAILGLLSISPMSGYDIHVAVDGSIRHFWPISKTQVYAEVTKLEQAGLIAGAAVAQQGVPDKRVFTLTAAGEQALDDWLETGETPPPQFRVPFLLKVLFAHRRDPARTAEMLSDLSEDARAEAAGFREFREALEGVDHGEYGALAVGLGERIAEAIADWAKDAAGKLPVDRFVIDVHRSNPRNAQAMFRRAPRAGER